MFHSFLSFQVFGDTFDTFPMWMPWTQRTLNGPNERTEASHLSDSMKGVTLEGLVWPPSFWDDLGGIFQGGLGT